MCACACVRVCVCMRACVYVGKEHIYSHTVTRSKDKILIRFAAFFTATKKEREWGRGGERERERKRERERRRRRWSRLYINTVCIVTENNVAAFIPKSLPFFWFVFCFIALK